MPSLTRLVVGKRTSSRALLTADCHVGKSPQDMPRQQFPLEGTVYLCQLLSSETSHAPRDSGTAFFHYSCWEWCAIIQYHKSER